MRSWLLILGVVCSLVSYYACAPHIELDDCEKDGTCEDRVDDCRVNGICEDHFELIEQILADLERRENDLKNDSGSDEVSREGGLEDESGSDEVARKRRSADQGYGQFDNSMPTFERFGGFERFSRPSNDRIYDGSSKHGDSDYRGFYYRVPKPTYRKSYQEGKWHLDNKHLIKNYYKKGTYELAKRYFIALPFVKIIPVTTRTSVDYIGKLRTYNGYSVRLCKTCYHGNPQIEFQSLSQPSRNVFRRFNFLPNTRRVRTEYGTPRIIQTGQARVSQAGYHGDGSYRDQGEGHH